jgi:hypothetical protein
MPAEGDNYRGFHKAPSGENGEGSLDAMDRTYPEDLYSTNGARYYGTRDKSDAEMISIIQSMRGKPDELVSVYRAVPKGTKGEINAGDWVTPSKAYARLHGGRWEEGMIIIEKKVPAGELFTEGNSIYEFGWNPNKKSRTDVLREEIASEEKWMERRRSQAPVLWETKGSKIYGQRMDIERRISSLKYELNNLERKDKDRTSFMPAEDWSTQRAIKTREGQPRQLWSYPDTENFKKWVGKLKFIGNEEDANKAVNYDKGFVTTVYKGVSVRSFDKFSERAKVQDSDRPVTSDPNFFIADKTAAERYAGGGYFDVSNLNEDAQKAASRGQADMYYIKSNKPANLLNAHKLERGNPRLFEVVNRFWENNIKESGHDILDSRTSVDRFLLEIAMGNWLSPKNEITMLSPFGQPWRMDNWVKFHEHLLNNGYDSVVIQDNSVSKKAPTVVVPQETAKVKASSNYGDFSKTDTRYNFQPNEPMPPSRDQGFNRVYRQISRSKKAATRSIKQSYLDRWGIDLGDFEKYKQLTDALDIMERDAEEGKEIPDFISERRDLKSEISDLEDFMTGRIQETQGEYAHQFTDQLDELEIGVRKIDSVISTISEQPLSRVGTWSGTNRLEAVLTRELGSGFGREISGDDIVIADSFREYANVKYEQDYLGAAFESELYSSDYIIPQKGKHHYTIPASEGSNKKGILVDVLRSENKLTEKGLPQGEVNPRRIINALRNKSGGDSKVYAEAKAMGLIDWLESKQEGQNQKKITTKELIEFVENNKMGLVIDPQLVQSADFGDTRGYVSGGETQSRNGYRVFVVRMMNQKHQHGVEGHFNGAVVHIRVTTRKSKDGKKVFHIEEIQANNSNTGVLSPAQKEIAKKEFLLFDLYHKEKGDLLAKNTREYNNAKSHSYVGDEDGTAAEYKKQALDTYTKIHKESEEKLSYKYAEKLYDLNPEYWAEMFNNKERTRDNLLRLTSAYIASHDVSMMASERKTSANKVANNAPLQDPKEWVKIAFRTVLRKAFVEGIDRITLTPWDETPLQVGMKSKKAKRFYEGIVVDAFNSELAKMNSVLEAKNSSISDRQRRITEANVKLNDSIQEVATAVDVNANNNGADVRKLFEYLHMSDADLDNKFGSQMNTYMSSPYEFLKWSNFETEKLPPNYKGKDALEKAISRREQKLRLFVEDQGANEGLKTPSGKNVAAGSMSESEYLVDRSLGFDLTPEMKKKGARPQKMLQPAEFTQFTTEQTAAGRILKNAKGYSIMMVNNKFRVYNPAKVILGVYGNEEEAKKRIYREMPKR